tara:strand:+ start:56 stop:190 length:135 start_codon:yes stop_codon:yes gene_type:complete
VKVFYWLFDTVIIYAKSQLLAFRLHETEFGIPLKGINIVHQSED